MAIVGILDMIDGVLVVFFFFFYTGFLDIEYPKDTGLETSCEEEGIWVWSHTETFIVGWV